MSTLSEEVDAAEKGDNVVPEDPRETGTRQAPPSTVSARRRQRYARMFLVLCVILFVVLVPTLVILNNNDNESSDAAKSEIGGTSTGDTDAPSDDISTTPDSTGNQFDGTTKDNGISSSVFNLTGPFNGSLRVFSEDIAQGYSDITELRKDLANSARFFLNNVLNRNLRVTGYESVGFGRQNPNAFVFRPPVAYDGGPIPVAAPAPGGYADADTSFDRGSAASESAQGEGTSVGDDVNDFGTNNQEDAVEEGDQIVSDGELVYAAYGDYIAIWNATSGEMVDQIQMPPIEPLDNAPPRGGYGYYGGYGGMAYIDVARPFYYNPKPQIQTLLLHENRLLVIVSGYGNTIAASTIVDRAFPILHDYQSTHIRIYDTMPLTARTGDTLDLVGTRDVNGRFNAVRSVDGIAHISTFTGIDTYTDLVAPFERSLFRDLTDDEYTAEVVRLAEEKHIPNFVSSLEAELGEGVTEFPDWARVSLWTTEVSSDGVVEQLSFAEGPINSATQVLSVDLTDNSESLRISAAGAFVPSNWASVYAAQDTIIIAGQGWAYNSVTGRSEDMTYLLGLAINGASTTPTSTGTVSGATMNSYSIDVVGNILRIATTIQNFWFRPEPIPFEEEDTLLVDEEVFVPPESRTANYVIVLEMPDATGNTPGAMIERGRVQLGKPNERFTAVRFFDNIAYAVTFERRDPFYALDLSDPDNPVVLGELDISGFSNYLYPINADNTMILAVGEEADDEGISLGLQITIYDATNPAEPFAVQRYVVEQDRETYSSSQAQWDFKSFRYVADHLIIPVSIYSWENYGDNFDGFLVFFATEDLIEERCRISNIDFALDEVNSYCYYCAYLPARSFVFDGNLMTTHNHKILSTDLGTCTNVWSLDVMIRSEDGQCCGVW